MNRDRQPPPMELFDTPGASVCSSVSTITCSIESSSRSISAWEGTTTILKPVSSLSCDLGESCDEEMLNSARWLGSPTPPINPAAVQKHLVSHHDPSSLFLEGIISSSLSKQSPNPPRRPPQSPAKVEPQGRKPAWQLREALKRFPNNKTGDAAGSSSSPRDFIPRMPTRATRQEKSNSEIGSGGGVEEVLSSRRKQLVRRIEEIQDRLDSEASSQNVSVPSLFEEACQKISRNEISNWNSRTSSKGGTLEGASLHPPKIPVRGASQVLQEDPTISSNDSSHSQKLKTSKKSKTKSSSSSRTSRRKIKKKKKKTTNNTGGCSDNEKSPETMQRKVSKQNEGGKVAKQQRGLEAPRRPLRSRSRSPPKEQLVSAAPQTTCTTQNPTLTAAAPTKNPKSYIPRGVLKRHKSELRHRRDFIRNSLQSILEDDNENLSPLAEVNLRRKRILVSQSCPSVYITRSEDNNKQQSPRRRGDVQDQDKSTANTKCWQGVGTRTLTVNG